MPHGGRTVARGLAEHDKDCGRAFLPDDIVQPLYAGFADYLEIPQVHGVQGARAGAPRMPYCVAAHVLLSGSLTGHPQGRCQGAGPDGDSVDRYCGEVPLTPGSPGPRRCWPAPPPPPASPSPPPPPPPPSAPPSRPSRCPPQSLSSYTPSRHSLP